MTPEKTIAIAYEIAREAHPDHFDCFKANWRVYHSAIVSETYPILYRCAVLICDSLEEMDKKGGKPSKLTAAKHITTNASSDTFHGVWTDDQGRTCMCDGYRAARLTDAFASIPVVAAWPELSRVFAEPVNYSRPLELPTVAAVKKSAAQQKAAEGRNCRPVWDFGEGMPLVSADYLLDMLALMPGCTAYIADSKVDVSPIYFRAENGDGILLPVRRGRR